MLLIIHKELNMPLPPADAYTTCSMLNFPVCALYKTTYPVRDVEML